MKFTPLAKQSLRPRDARYSVTETGVSNDRRGLQLVVEPSGSKRFVARFKIDGRSHKHTLGSLGSGPDSIDVAEARRRLDEVRKHSRQGVARFAAGPLAFASWLRRRRQRLIA